MLANPHHTQHQLSYPYRTHSSQSCSADLNSPSIDTFPHYFTNSFGTSAPSPSQGSARPSSQQQLFGGSLNTSESQTYSQLGGNTPLMQSTYYNTQAPHIRVQQSSPVPQLSENALMQHEWQFQGQGSAQYRKGGKHQRTFSRSTIGSDGPTSPYNTSTSHPQIAQSELSPRGLDSIYQDDFPSEQHASPHMSKPFEGAQDSFLAPAFQNFDPQGDSTANQRAKLAMIQALKDHHGDGDSPAPAFSVSGRHSVSSVDHHSPRTPKTTYSEDIHDGGKNGMVDFHTVNRWLDEYLHFDTDFSNSIPTHNMSDAFVDELYNSSVITSAPSAVSRAAASQNALLSPYRSIFSERIKQANNEHLRDMSPTSSLSGPKSPFRHDSPFAMSSNGYGSRSPQSTYGSASQLREKQRAEANSAALRDHQRRAEESLVTPKTVSPKDVTLEFHENEEDAKMPLFPQDGSDLDDLMSDRTFGGIATSRRQSTAFSHGGFNFTPPSIPGSVAMPQQYQYSQPRRQSAFMQHGNAPTPEFPAHLTSMESSISDGLAQDYSRETPKPHQTTADTGVYTCTYHGCTLRFETPAKLQKHKREGHRQANTSTAANAEHANGMTAAALLRNSQAGPHKCDRINPSTGKPCNTIFSRPYDLTRHEDTIHNARKQKVRCHLCTEEKTFSRNDALTRHMRVVHPDVDFPGKTRRKGQD